MALRPHLVAFDHRISCKMIRLFSMQRVYRVGQQSSSQRRPQHSRCRPVVVLWQRTMNVFERMVLMIGIQTVSCALFLSSSSSVPPEQPEVIRTANRLADNEGKSVVLDGLAVDVAGR